MKKQNIESNQPEFVESPRLHPTILNSDAYKFLETWRRSLRETYHEDVFCYYDCMKYFIKGIPNGIGPYILRTFAESLYEVRRIMTQELKLDTSRTTTTLEIDVQTAIDLYEAFRTGLETPPKHRGTLLETTQATNTR